jgi:hypothetical protein
MKLTEYPGLRHDVSSFVSMDYSPHLLSAVLRSQTTVFDFAKRPVGTVAVSDDPLPYRKTSAQSPPRPDATISRLDPPSPRVGGLLPQALVSGLQHLEVERIACDSSRRSAGNCRLPHHVYNQMTRLFERIVRVRSGIQFWCKRSHCFCWA